MAQRRKTVGPKSSPKRQPKKAQSFVKKQNISVMKSSPFAGEWGIDEGTIQAQAARLGDPRLPPVQRQALATQIGHRQGNEHLQQVLLSLNANPTQKQRDRIKPNAIQRHTVAEAPPPVEEEEVQTSPQIQRHTIAEAPPSVEEEEVQTKPLVQRMSTRQAAFGKIGFIDQNGRINGSSIQRWKPGKAPTGTAGTGPKIGTTRVKLGNITFTPKEIPADGATTTQAAVTTTPGGRTINWSLTGNAYGSTISPTGVITPGNNTGGNKKVTLQVKAVDSKTPTASKTRALTVWDAKYYKAKKDYPRFLAGGPYKFPNFTIGLNGKFDLEYSPAAKLANVNVKVKFTFPDDQQPGSSLWNLWGLLGRSERRAREARHTAYRQNFIRQIKAAWSQRYQFQNIREPKSIWGKLNPTSVKVNVQEVDKNQHFEIQVRQKTKGRAQVHHGVTKLYKGDDTPSPEFNPGTKRGELKRVRRILPKITFANNSAVIDNKYNDSINFLATYLKRINNPQFKLDIVGHASTTGKPAKNQTLSTQRAEAVKTALTAAGLTNHVLASRGVGQAGADATAKWRKVDITPSLVKAGWENLQDVTAHEFGHMIGLGDEYGAGLATHYNLVKKAFGEPYAKQVAKRGDTDYASVMEGGNDVRIQHYVTFWSALCETTMTKAALPDPKFGYGDWKFIG